MILHTRLNEEGLDKMHSDVIVVTAPLRASSPTLNSEQVTPTSSKMNVKPILTVEAVQNTRRHMPRATQLRF